MTTEMAEDRKHWHLMIQIIKSRQVIARHLGVRSTMHIADLDSFFSYRHLTLTRLNKIAIQGTPQMAAGKEAISLRPAQTRGSDLTSGLTMLWAKDVALVCSVTSGSISPH